MADFDGYPPVMDEEEEQRKQYAGYPPVAPPNPEAYLKGRPASVEQSSYSAPATLTDMTKPAPNPNDYVGVGASRLGLMRPSPEYKDYAPPEPKSGIGKFGRAFGEMVTGGPQRSEERAKTAYEAATKEHDTDFSNQLKITQEERAESAEKSKSALEKSQSDYFNQRLPEAERVAKEKEDAAQKRVETQGDTARDVAATKSQNQRQPIRVMGNETYERQTDGSWKVIGPAPPRAEAGNYSPVNDENGATVAWVNPKSGHMVKVGEIQGMEDAAPGGAIPPKPSGMTRSRQDQAAAIDRASNGLIKTLEASKDKVGNVKAILESAFLRTPLADPELSGIATELASYAALQPALHGFRGQDALNEFMKIIGGVPKNADALISSIKAIQKTAGYVNPRIGGGGEKPSPPKVGDVVKGHEFLGGDPADKKNWKKATEKK